MTYPFHIPKPEWPCWLWKERDSPEGRPGGCGLVSSPHHLIRQTLPAGAMSEPKQAILSPGCQLPASPPSHCATQAIFSLPCLHPLPPSALCLPLNSPEWLSPCPFVPLEAAASEGAASGRATGSAILPEGVRGPPPTLPGSAHHLSQCPLPSLRLPTPFPAAHSFPALEMQSLRRASRAVGCSRSARGAR